MQMMYPKSFFPDQAGALKGLPGVPLPFCLLHISYPFDEPTPDRKYEFISRQKMTLSRRIEKIIRRLLLKAGIPILSNTVSTVPQNGLSFHVHISISLLHEGIIDYSVRMELIQEVLLARDPAIKIEAVTWGGHPVTGRYRSAEESEEFLVEEITKHIIQVHIRSEVRSLVSNYRYDNQPDEAKQIEYDRSYDTGPLNDQ
jgi:hypothetical protein